MWVAWPIIFPAPLLPSHWSSAFYSPRMLCSVTGPMQEGHAIMGGNTWNQEPQQNSLLFNLIVPGILSPLWKVVGHLASCLPSEPPAVAMLCHLSLQPWPCLVCTYLCCLSRLELPLSFFFLHSSMCPHFLLAYLALGPILLSGPHGLDRTEPEARTNGQTLPWPSERCMDCSRAFSQGCELK